MNIKKFLAGSITSGLFFALSATSALAASYTLFGDAQIVTGGNPGNAAQLRSDATVLPGFGGVRFSPVPATIASLATLGTDFNVTDDDCFGGSPRFQIRVDMDNDGIVSAGDGNVFVYPGPFPNYSGCTANIWVSSGNLVTDPNNRWDTGQVGGTFYDSYANASALTAGKAILRISLVVDSSWGFADNEQTVLVDNVLVNNDLYTFDPILVGPPANKDECKNGGWESFNNPTFKNQGDCISYVQSSPNALGNK